MKHISTSKILSCSESCGLLLHTRKKPGLQIYSTAFQKILLHRAPSFSIAVYIRRVEYICSEFSNMWRRRRSSEAYSSYRTQNRHRSVFLETLAVCFDGILALATLCSESTVGTLCDFCAQLHREEP